MAKDESEDLKGRSSMTKESIINSCKKNKLYSTPSLNDVLYLHYQGYQKIENLDEYTGLKCLWLECNAISQISGLDKQMELRCLFLHNNFIRQIANLQHCVQLDTLNLSHNYIKSIENCNSTILPLLNTLYLSHNSLSSIDGLEELVKCENLSVLDLSHNRIEDVLVVKVLSRMPALRVLTLTGNPVVNEIPSYRKTLIVECKKLTYLDSRPVFEKDRACAEAWKRGGFEEEKRELSKWNAAQQKRVMDSVRATLRLKQKKQEKEYAAETFSDDNQKENGSPNALPTSCDEKLENSSLDASFACSSEETIDSPTIPGFINQDHIEWESKTDHVELSIETVSTPKLEIKVDSITPSVNPSRKNLTSSDSKNNNATAIITKSLTKLPTDTIADAVTPNVLKIFQNSDSNIEISQRNNAICQNSKKPTSDCSKSERKSAIIEVISSSDGVDNTECHSMNELNSKNAPKLEISNDRIVANEHAMNSPEKNANQNEFALNECHMQQPSKQSAKPNAITFFCENLDELKRTDSDTDESIEEIQQFSKFY